MHRSGGGDNFEKAPLEDGRQVKVDFTTYLITDRLSVEERGGKLLGVVEEALEGGIKAVQLREKDLGGRELLALALSMRELTSRYDALLFINDRLDVALAAGADGVHLGVASVGAAEARTLVGKEGLIGVSAHCVAEAKSAEAEGADFITLGPVYETPSKSAYGPPLTAAIIREAAGELSIPVFAIGGIRTERVEEVVSAGASGVAVISEILFAEHIREKTRELLEEIERRRVAA